MPEKKGIAVEFIREEVWLQSHTASVAAGSMVLDKQKKPGINQSWVVVWMVRDLSVSLV